MTVLRQRVIPWIAKGLASGGYISYIPVWALKNRRYSGAGLIGTFWGLALVRWLPLDAFRQLLVWLGGVALAVAISDKAEEYYEGKDDSRIVIDEMIGYWTAVLFLPRTTGLLIAAFVLFRLFDVLKPGFIRQAGNFPGGWGVVIDDLLAGAATCGILHVVRIIHPF